MKEIKTSIPFISFWVVNSILIYLINMLLPQNFELGTSTIPASLAFLWTGAWLTLLVWIARPATQSLGFNLKGEVQKFSFYWVTNTATIWILARVAEYSGFGISRFYWAIVLGLIVNVVQWGLWQALRSYKLV